MANITAATRAAISFHECAMDELVLRGERATASRIAEIIECDPSAYGSIRHGRTGHGSLDTVYQWILRWGAAGYPPMLLVLGIDLIEVGPMRTEAEETRAAETIWNRRGDS